MQQTLKPTDKIAELLDVKGESIRRSLSVNGHYMGIKPVKLPNRRLMWPLAEFERLLSGGAK